MAKELHYPQAEMFLLLHCFDYVVVLALSRVWQAEPPPLDAAVRKRKVTALLLLLTRRTAI